MPDTAKIATFGDLEFKEHPTLSGVLARCRFENGYGVSVVRNQYSYGGREGLYELAVTTAAGIAYDTPITDDVLGWLTEADVTRVLSEVAALPVRTEQAAS